MPTEGVFASTLTIQAQLSSDVSNPIPCPTLSSNRPDAIVAAQAGFGACRLADNVEQRGREEIFEEGHACSLRRRSRPSAMAARIAPISDQREHAAPTMPTRAMKARGSLSSSTRHKVGAVLHSALGWWAAAMSSWDRNAACRVRRAAPDQANRVVACRPRYPTSTAATRSSSPTKSSRASSGGSRASPRGTTAMSLATTTWPCPPRLCHRRAVAEGVAARDAGTSERHARHCRPAPKPTARQSSETASLTLRRLS